MAVFEHLDSIIDSITEVRAYQGRRQQVQAQVANWDDDSLVRLTQHARTYPRTPFGVLEGLVRANIPPEHPVARQVTDLNYWRQAQEGVEPGQTVFGRLAANMREWSHQLSEQRKLDQPAYIRETIKTPEYNTATLPRRLLMIEEARLRAGVPLTFKEQLIQRGILKDDEIHRPTRPHYKGRENGEAKWEFDSKYDEDTDRMFLELMATIARDQKTSDPIPFVVDDEGESVVRLYHPRTRKTSLAAPEGGGGRSGIPNLDIPGPFDEMWNDVRDKGKQTINNWLDRRTPNPLGAPQVSGISTPGGTTGKDVIRGLGLVGEAPIQEAVGQVRNVYGATHGEDVNWTESQSDLGIVTGTGLSPGTGYLTDPESDAVAERRRRERERGLIGGHAVTPGRWFADSLPLSVDSKPFDLISGAVDFTAQVLDPTVVAAKGVSRVSAARRLFEPEEVTGLFSGVRRQFHGQTWNSYRQTNKRGQLIVDTIANASGDKSSPYDIWVAMGRKHNPELAQRLYDADTPEKVDDVFANVIGTQIRSPHEIDALPIRLGDNELLQAMTPTSFRTKFEDLVDVQMLPSHQLDTTNKLDAAQNMEKWLQVGRAGDDVIRDTFNMIAKADTKNGIEQAVEHAMTAENGVLAASGVKSEQKRRQLTNLFRQSQSRAFDSMMDDISGDTPIRDILMSKGIEIQDLDPQLTMEYIERFIPLPDVMRIRRVTADPKYRWLLTSMNAKEIGKARFPTAALQAITEDFWKPAMLLGRFPAWITRVVGEEQIRLAMSGLDGMFNHPISAISMMVGKKVTKTPSGNIFDEMLQYEAALAHTHGGMIRRAGASRSTPIHVDKLNPDQHDDWLRAWADQVALLHYDPVTRNLISTGVDDTMDWLKGKGRDRLRMLKEAEPGKFTSDAQIRTYLTDTLGERIRVLTQNDPELLDAIPKGKLGEASFFRRKTGPRLNNDFIDNLAAYEEKGPRLVKGYDKPTPSMKAKWDAAVDWGFANSMSRITNLASRSPAFKQLLWKNTADIMPYVDGKTRQIILQNAEEANLSGRLMRELKRKANQKGTTQITSVEEAENLAAGYALDGVKQNLYDLSERGLLAESLKLLAPFGNAYQELVTTWPKLLWGQKYGWAGKFANTARASRRVQQTVQGGRNNGWFMKNQFGEEVFVFPFSEAYTKAVTGVPVPMTGRVQGLNMAFDVFPGMGPVAAMPVAWMMDGKPGTWNDIYDRLLPYGAPGERNPNDISNILSYAPSWMQKMAIAVSGGPPSGTDLPWPSKDEVMWDNNAYMNVQKDVMKYLISTGDYDPTTPEGMLELTNDAKEKATDLYYIRAALQFFAPTAPAFEFLVEDKSGGRIAQWAVTEEFYNNLDEGMSMDEATFEMIEKYGLDVFSLTVPKTRAATYNVPRTREAGEWLANNPGIKIKYPGTYGFFAPQGGELDYSVLVNQYASGDVDVLRPDQWLNLRNDMLKSLEYNYYKDQVGQNPNDEQAAWLRGIRSELEEAYPSSTAGLLDKPEYPELITELQRSIEDPDLADNPVTQPLIEYFYYRNQAMEFATSAGYASFERPNALLPTREWLAGIAQDIMKDYPEFEFVWSTTLSREFERELR